MLNVNLIVSGYELAGSSEVLYFTEGSFVSAHPISLYHLRVSGLWKRECD
jgi:hypothetical protein